MQAPNAAFLFACSVLFWHAPSVPHHIVHDVHVLMQPASPLAIAPQTWSRQLYMTCLHMSPPIYACPVHGTPRTHAPHACMHAEAHSLCHGGAALQDAELADCRQVGGIHVVLHERVARPLGPVPAATLHPEQATQPDTNAIELLPWRRSRSH